MPKAPSRALAGSALSLCLIAATPCHADWEDADFARAEALEKAGKLREAALALEILLPAFPEDYALPVRVAWLYERALDLDRAEHFYREAIARSPAGLDARLGLARVLEATGSRAEARAIFEAILREYPDLADASDGMRRNDAVRVRMSIGAAGSLYLDHPAKWITAGGTVGVGLDHRSGFYLDGLYRYAHLVPPSDSPLSAWDQHEGYLSLGFSRPFAGIGGTYAAVYDGSGPLGLSHHFGLQARFSPLGDIALEGAVSVYSDMLVFRAEPSWKIPIFGGLSMKPAVGIADAGGQALATAMLTIALERRSFSLWAGAKYGGELRPVYLSVPVVYDTLDRIDYGAWAGVAVNVSHDLGIQVRYSVDRLEVAPTGAESIAHTLGIGVAAAF